METHDFEGMNLPYIDDRGALDLDAFQADVAAWADRNFGVVSPMLPFLGMVEEIGELAHAMLKTSQGIRGFGDEAKLRESQMDAVGDLFVFAANFAAKSGFSLEEAIAYTWRNVRRRDWPKHPETGVADSPG